MWFKSKPRTLEDIEEEMKLEEEKERLINNPKINDIPRCCGQPLVKGHCQICGDNYN